MIFPASFDLNISMVNGMSYSRYVAFIIVICKQYYVSFIKHRSTYAKNIDTISTTLTNTKTTAIFCHQLLWNTYEILLNSSSWKASVWASIQLLQIYKTSILMSSIICLNDCWCYFISVRKKPMIPTAIDVRKGTHCEHTHAHSYMWAQKFLS